jgi:hypothetical protein
MLSPSLTVRDPLPPYFGPFGGRPTTRRCPMNTIHRAEQFVERAELGPRATAFPSAIPPRFPSDREAKRAALLSAVESIREVATGCAHAAESQATMPAALVDAISSSGLWTMKLPAALARRCIRERQDARPSQRDIESLGDPQGSAEAYQPMKGPIPANPFRQHRPNAEVICAG